MKNLKRNYFFWILMVVVLAGAVSGNTIDFLRFRATTLPSVGKPGEVRLDSSTQTIRKWNATSSGWDSLGGLTGIVGIANGGTNSGTALNNNRVMVSSGSAIVEASAITANRALVSDANGIPTHSALTNTELGYFAGITATSGGLLYGTGSAIANTGAGVTDQVLTSNGSSAPVWAPRGGQNQHREYITGGHFENGTASFAAYSDAAAATPADGTGGSPNSSLAITTTSGEVLNGSTSLEFVKGAANRQGEGFSKDFTIDYWDRINSRCPIIQFNYKATANYPNGAIKLFVYDKDAAEVLAVLDQWNLAGALVPSTTGTKFTGQFCVKTTTSDDYRLIWHVVGTEATAWDFHVDNVSVGPNSTVPGAIVADYGTETWTDNQTNATTAIRNATREGNKLCVVGATTFTSTASGNIEVTIPTAYTPSSTVYPRNNSELLGEVRFTDASTATYDGFVTLSGTNTLTFVAGVTSSTYLNPSTAAASIPFAWNTGDFLDWKACWVVSNWAASAALSTTEALFSTAKARYSGGTQTISVASATILNASTKTYDTLNSVTTGANWKFTAPRSGYYSVDAFVQYVSRTYADGNLIVTQLFKNGVFYSQDGGTEISGTPAIVVTSSLSDTVYLAKGDYLDVRAYNTGSVSTNTDVFQIAVTEQPDFSIFSTYGTFELLTATSSVKTPSATNNYHQLTGNSLTLTPGTWRLKGTGRWANSGSTPTYSIGGGGWFSANGADSSSVPTALSSASGLTILSVGAADWYPSISPTTGLDADFPTVIVRVTQPVTVYLVSYATMTTAANARVTVYANAERLQ